MTELDRVIHEPARLRIAMILSGVDMADFNFLLNTLGLSKGNLSSHMDKLEVAQSAKGVAHHAMLERVHQARQVVQRSWPAILLSHTARLAECRPTYDAAFFVVEPTSNFRNASCVPEDYDV